MSITIASCVSYYIVIVSHCVFDIRMLKLQNKLEMIKLINKDTSYCVISRQFGIGISTISDIKKEQGQNRKICQF